MNFFWSGYFIETYNQKDMEQAGLTMVFVQDNQSMSVKILSVVAIQALYEFFLDQWHNAYRDRDGRLHK